MQNKIVEEALTSRTPSFTNITYKISEVTQHYCQELIKVLEHRYLLIRDHFKHSITPTCEERGEGQVNSSS